MKVSEFFKAIEYLKEFPDSELKVTYNNQELDFNDMSITASVSINSPVKTALNFEKREKDLDVIYVYNHTICQKYD